MVKAFRNTESRQSINEYRQEQGYTGFNRLAVSLIHKGVQKRIEKQGGLFISPQTTWNEKIALWGDVMQLLEEYPAGQYQDDNRPLKKRNNQGAVRSTSCS